MFSYGLNHKAHVSSVCHEARPLYTVLFSSINDYQDYKRHVISVNFAPGEFMSAALRRVRDVGVAVNLSSCLHFMRSCLLRMHTCNPHELMSGVYSFSPGFFPTCLLLHVYSYLFLSECCFPAMECMYTRFPRLLSGVARTA